LIVGVATVGRFTVKLNEVERVTPPPTADTVIVEVPAGVVPDVVVIVNTEEQVGLQVGVANDALAPAGKPELERVTAWVFPDNNVVVTKKPIDEPAVTVELPLLEALREKSNG